jgi:hypothetical protein
MYAAGEKRNPPKAENWVFYDAIKVISIRFP